MEGNGGEAKAGAKEGVHSISWDSRSRMTVDLRVPTTPARRTSGFHGAGKALHIACLPREAP